MFSLNYVEPVTNVRQPRLVGKRKNSTIEDYVAGQNERVYGLGEDELMQRKDIFRAFFQPEREVSKVFIPTPKPFFDIVMRGIPISVYKGVSFNPLLQNFGERFDNLDFFGWAKRVQGVCPLTFVVLDAGPYWLINTLKRGVKFSYSPNVAEEVVNFLLEQKETPIGSNIAKSAALRNAYLTAMAELLNPQGIIVSVDQIWQSKSQAYLEKLQRAIEFVMKPTQTGELEIDKFVRYRRYDTAFEKWYTPLVIAEALYLAERFGVNSKLGPTSERGFDKVIREVIAKEMAIKYVIFWYTRPFDGIIGYKNKIFFSDSADTIERKLMTNDNVRKWTAEIASPFFNSTRQNDLAGIVYNLVARINKRAEQILYGG